MSVIHNKYLLLFLRIIMGLIFIYSGIQKISDPRGFGIAIENYRIFPFFIINFLAITIPWLELITGMFLLFGILLKESSSIINVLLFLFIILLVSALIRKLDIDCGCFGTFDNQKVGLKKLLENTFLFVIGFYIYKTANKQSFTIPYKND